MTTSLASDQPLLFTPIELREVRLRNRIVLSPMCQYSATDGAHNDWHFAHLAKFATGGFGAVFVEATAVERRGRITHGCSGLWRDDQIPPLKRAAAFLKAQGAVPGIQLAHAGRKAGAQRPWHGNGPLGADDIARGEAPWETVGASPIAVAEGWPAPRELAADEIPALIAHWVAAVRRALAAGFELLEIHGAHGYLIQSFLSPISNRRDDRYGGDLAGRMRLALEIAEAVRAEWPEAKPLFFRISAVDGVDGGWSLDDSVVLVRELKARGVDVIDCSSGGVLGPVTAAKGKRRAGFQVPYAERLRRETGARTQAVGLITHPGQAEDILRNGQADLIAIGREALYDPYWPRHAAATLGADPEFAGWPQQYGWWLVRRARSSEFYRQPDSPEATAAE